MRVCVQKDQIQQPSTQISTFTFFIFGGKVFTQCNIQILGEIFFPVTLKSSLKPIPVSVCSHLSRGICYFDYQHVYMCYRCFYGWCACVMCFLSRTRPQVWRQDLSVALDLSAWLGWLELQGSTCLLFLCSVSSLLPLQLPSPLPLSHSPHPPFSEVTTILCHHIQFLFKCWISELRSPCLTQQALYW